MVLFNLNTFLLYSKCLTDSSRKEGRRKGRTGERGDLMAHVSCFQTQVSLSILKFCKDREVHVPFNLLDQKLQCNQSPEELLLQPDLRGTDISLDCLLFTPTSSPASASPRLLPPSPARSSCTWSSSQDPPCLSAFSVTQETTRPAGVDSLAPVEDSVSSRQAPQPSQPCSSPV